MAGVAERGPEGDRVAGDGADRRAGVGERPELPQHHPGERGKAQVGIPGPAPPASDEATPRIPASAQTPQDVRCGRVPPRSTSAA